VLTIDTGNIRHPEGLTTADHAVRQRFTDFLPDFLHAFSRRMSVRPGKECHLLRVSTNYYGWEDIAADITKYGDGGKHVLFVVYDPSHFIADDAEFSKEILRRSTMHVEIVR
jgi:hypothetical protein